MTKSIFTLWFLLIAGSGWTATSYVDGNLLSNCTSGNYSISNRSCTGSDGDAWRTIFEGLNDTNIAGDVLNIREGIYPERIESGSQTIVSGTSWENPVTIQGHASEVVTLRPTYGDVVIQVNTPSQGNSTRYVVFKNLIVDATNTNFGVAIGGGNNGGTVDHIKLDGLEVKNAIGDAVLIGGPHGGGDSSWLTDVKIHNNGTAGDGHGLYVESSNNIVEYSEIYNQSGYGIHNYAGSASNNIYRYSTIYGNGTNLGRIAWGILVTTGGNNQIYGNVIVNNQNGVTSGSEGNQILNNTIYGNGINLPCRTVCDSAIQLSNSANTVVRNNIVFGNFRDNIEASGDRGTVSSSNLQSDPSFVDVANNDFRLLPGSAAIGNGTSSIPEIGAPFGLRSQRTPE